MPELPDLHVFSANLKKHILGKKIVSVQVGNSDKMNAAPRQFEAALTGRAIVDITRDGKELFFRLSDGNVFSVHLMLYGRFALTAPGEPEAVRDRVVSMTFEDQSAFSISDWQGLCRVSLNPSVRAVPDALSEQFDLSYLTNIAKKNAKKNIKAFLIDQNIVKGIGNAYADEILFEANISPESVVGSLPDEAVAALYAAVRNVLEHAIRKIIELSPDIIGGEERRFLKVHNKTRKTTDEGDPILVKTVATKTTYYTEKQVLYK